MPGITTAGLKIRKTRRQLNRTQNGFEISPSQQTKRLLIIEIIAGIAKSQRWRNVNARLNLSKTQKFDVIMKLTF